LDASPRKARDVFLAAIKLPSEEREAYVQGACGEVQALHQRVAALLQAQAEIGSFHEAPGVTVDQPITESPGTVIGPYQFLEQIGEGGMGTVWMAQQTAPVERLVAIKRIKPGMDSRPVLAMFEGERQALALMDHPNIAKVFDAGAAPDGRPYFVMELVKGVPITHYCDAHRLTPRQRLELFVPVCQAIQHAHQKGIIHRDIKPSNVLVALYDDKPVPKVIDFGVAKATGPQLTEQSLHTGFGTVVGTVEYMSPEQAGLNQLDIDTRSDVYSLGVLLYELLAGSPPFTRTELEKPGVLEMLRVIREDEPTKPSTKLSTAESLPTLAANRGIKPAKLTRLVRGDLDSIVMKALEKDRNRRYETANGLAMDLQRYLCDEPVTARPPSAVYQLRKFARRHKGPALAASLVVLALVGGVIGTTWGMLAAKAEAATEKQVTKAAKARQVETLQGKWLANQSEAKVAPEQNQAAHPPDTKHQGPDHSDTRIVAAREAKSHEGLGPHLQTLKLQKEILFQQVIDLGPDHPKILETMTNIARTYHAMGRRVAALELLEKTLALKKAKLGPHDPDTLATMTDIANSYNALGRHDEALKLHEETLALQKAKLGPDAPGSLSTMWGLANSYQALGRHADALKLREEALALAKTKHGPDSTLTLGIMNSLARSLATVTDAKLRDPARAVRLAKEIIQHFPNAGDYWNTLGMAYYSAGDWGNAIMALEKSEGLSLVPNTACNGFFLAMAHWQLGEKEKARSWYGKAATWMDEQKPKDAELLRVRAKAAELLGIKTRERPIRLPPTDS
jgi:serine/threonine-protein kinase